MTVREIADARLPGMPHTRQGVAARAAAEGWDAQTDGRIPRARRRPGRGGGIEYNAGVLPETAVMELQGRAAATANAPGVATPVSVAEQWAAYELLGSAAKAKARDALAIVQRVETLMQAGLGKVRAIDQVTQSSSVKAATIYRWFGLISGVPASDRLPFLAPNFKGGGQSAEIDSDLWTYMLSDFLRLSRPSWESSYERVKGKAKARAATLPSSRTLLRRMEATVPKEVRVLMRDGEDALRLLTPPQQRSVAGMKALELVNIDGHTCDVRVRFPDGTIGRPVLIAIQDVMSRKFLAWRYAPSEDSVTARLCFADLFRKYGVPEALLADNGRAFACKWLSGGMATRFRFKVKQDEPIGLMKMLGIEMMWATPYHGQAKPIERGFRDFCDAIAKHPAFEGAYTGNNPLNKPENYGSRAVEWDEFVRVWDQGIAAHNARAKRRTEMGKGIHSFDEVYAQSIAVHGCRQATDSHLRLALMAGEQIRAHRDDGSVTILGNRYWDHALTAVAGQPVTVRYDPEDTAQPVHVYEGERLVAVAERYGAVGFRNAGEAKVQAKLVRDHRKATKVAAKSLDLLKAHELATLYASLTPDYEDETPPETTVIRPVRVRGNTALKPLQQAVNAPAAPDFLDSFLAGAERRLRIVE